MTNQPLDELDRLSSPEEAQKTEDNRNRPRSRNPLRWFKADILGTGPDLTIENRSMGSWEERGVWLDVLVKEIYRSDPPIEEMNQKIWVRYPNSRRDGKPSDPDINSEPVLMVDAARSSDPSVTSIRSLPGRKGVVFKEEAHHFTYTKNTNTNVPDPERPGQTIWDREEKQATTFYYSLDFANPPGRNYGVSPSEPTTPSEEGQAKALSLIIDAGEEGIEEAAFGLAAMKDAVVKKDKVLIGAIADGKWASEMIASGKILREGDKLVTTGN